MEQGTKEWILEMRKKIKSRTVLKNDCWIWAGPIFSDGYGNAGSGYPDQRAHRSSFILFNGKIPKGSMILHVCDIPLCINPQHLYLGDAKQNAKDALERGLHPKGPNPKKSNPGGKNGRAKLSEKQVISIRKEYIFNENGAQKLARKYKISKRQVLNILKRETWKNI